LWVGMTDQRSCDGDALSLAAGQVFRPMIGPAP
jgi:hypothetical protein